MKLNIFTYVYHPEPFLINELSQELSKVNETTVLTGLPNYPKGEFYPGYSLQSGPYQEQLNQVKIIRYPILPRKKGFLRLALNYLSHILGASLAQKKLPPADWALVFATSPITTAIPAILWARFNKAKVCIWLQDLWPDSVAAVGAMNRKSFIYKILGLVVKWIYKRTDLMLIQSPGFTDNLKEFGYTGPAFVVPNWAPDLDFEKVTTPEWLNLKPGTFKVTFAGNIGIAQSIETILSACEILKNNSSIEFLIVGDGSELGATKQKAMNLGLKNIHFFGRKPLSDMPGLFKASDALLVTLKKDPIFSLTIPSKIQAYMAAGKPIIGSFDGVGGQILEQAGCGFHAEAEDAQGLAAAVQKMSELSTEQRAGLGQKAQQYFQAHYRKDHIIKQIIGYLEDHRL